MSAGQVDGEATARWLDSQRFAGLDTAGRRASEARLTAVRDRVLDAAEVAAGQHVVDLGAGTGLLASAALGRVGPAGAVTAVDLSAAALKLIRPAPGSGQLHRVVCDVATLPLPDGSTDAVVARSVLVHVADVRAVLAEAARVLRPGGRLSVFEPVNGRRHHDATLDGITPAELAAIDQAVSDATPAARTMRAFDERTTATATILAGFYDVTLAVDTVTTVQADVTAVEASLRRPGHPGAPSPLDTVTRTLGADLARRYADAWRAAVRRHPVTWTTPVAYLAATR